jgi:GT2 family glycosyltransferase
MDFYKHYFASSLFLACNRVVKTQHKQCWEKVMIKSIDFGIVNYNGGTALSNCIRSIKNLTGVQTAIFIVDNASLDDSMQKARELFPECEYLPSSENLGYAGGCNLLLEKMSAEIVVLCNMDLEFHPDWGMSILECYQQNPDVSSVGPLVIEKDTQRVYSSGVAFYRDLYPLSSSQKPQSDEPYETVCSYGAVMTFRRNIFQKIGYFDADYFLFFEETEFYLRMSINRMKTLFCPTAIVYHERSIATVRYSPLKLYYSERNRIWTAFKYFPLWYFPITFSFSALRFYCMSKSGVPSKDGNGKKLKPSMVVITLLKAWIGSFFSLGREWKKRRILWKNTDLNPGFTLQLIEKYKLARSELHIR